MTADNKIPDYAKEYIKQEVRKERWSFLDCGLKEADKYAQRAFYGSWDLFGFESKWECEHAFSSYIMAQRIRAYCRRNKLTTRKGTLHCLNGLREHYQLWDIVRNASLDNEADGMRWSVRKVDGLKNMYFWF